MIISGQLLMKENDNSALKHLIVCVKPYSFLFPCRGKWGGLDSQMVCCQNGKAFLTWALSEYEEQSIPLIHAGYTAGVRNEHLLY